MGRKADCFQESGPTVKTRSPKAPHLARQRRVGGVRTSGRILRVGPVRASYPISSAATRASLAATASRLVTLVEDPHLEAAVPICRVRLQEAKMERGMLALGCHPRGARVNLGNDIQRLARKRVVRQKRDAPGGIRTPDQRLRRPPLFR